MSLDKPVRAPSVLFVEDDPCITELLVLSMSANGFEVGNAISAEEALEQLSTRSYDAVVIDIGLPGIDGLTLLRMLRRSYGRFDLPVLMFTADVNEAGMHEAFNLGANDYIVKNEPAHVLRDRLMAHLAMRREWEKVHPRRLALGRKALKKPHTTASQLIRTCPTCDAYVLSFFHECWSCHNERPKTGWIPGEPKDGVGELIGQRFLTVRHVGSGSSADVYEAIEIELGKRYALKRIHLAPLFREHTYTEVRALSRLSSPHVVTVHQVLQPSEEELVLVLDFAEGQTLDTFLETRQLDIDMALEIATQAARALWAVHERGWVHRDVKPSNLMVERLVGGAVFVRLLDFGVLLPSALETNREHFMGTPTYAAPEQSVSVSDVSLKSDIYALGCVLYEMLTGAPPFGSTDKDVLLKRHALTPLPSLPEKLGPPSSVKALNALLFDMTRKRPSARIPNTETLIARIDAIRHNLKLSHGRHTLRSGPAPAPAESEGNSTVSIKLSVPPELSSKTRKIRSARSQSQTSEQG